MQFGRPRLRASVWRLSREPPGLLGMGGVAAVEVVDPLAPFLAEIYPSLDVSTGRRRFEKRTPLN